ncbi:hypothetical protein BCR36DRAFT_280771 [Piromyces finnis]|uniref:Zn(2)-C6 fungal-type domain-containing protein n=1 Tax=Piromyces finnis TaxID=1754191 RepID=A0A1Y1VI53_9FUNG|nr:hypothetical protein BCR36DRAFT_280771 [Piromyces finnis]|eukprot:ORX56064.1 hypothetical protein BCR36DRAFT_280771 [Piromyces finnis]
MDKSKKKVRRKVTQACENCREKRVKCSGGRPTCDSCRQLNITCVYNAVTKKRGPRSGYIEEIVSTRVQKLFEKYVSEGLISKKDISILAKNNVDMFKSSEILKCYIEGEDKKEENVENSNLNNNVNFEGNTFLNSENEKREEFLSKLSKINKNKVLIASTVNKAENIGCSMININLSSCNYNIVTVNYDLIESYFEYSHSHFPMLVKEVFLDRIKKNTILPGLLLAVYASALIFRPNPDYNASKKYLRLSHIYCSIYYHSSDIQSIQAISLLANCTCGSNFSWILFGIALRMAYLLKLDEEDKNLSEIYNEERKFTFWYVISKDMLLSVITGRSYRYDLYSFLCSPTIKSILFNFKPKRSYFNLLFQIILANLLQKVIQYVRRRNSRLEEVDLVEKEIDYWFKLLEPEFNYQKSDNIENTSIGEIIGSIHFDIIFSTLKIIYYRHKPTSVITTNRKNHYLEKLISIFLKLDKDPMSEENVDIQSDLNDDKKYQSYPYEFEEIDGFKHKKSGKIKYDYFLKKAYDILKNKRTNFNRKDIEIKSTKGNVFY